MTYSIFDDENLTSKNSERELTSAHHFTVGELRIQENYNSRIEQIKRGMKAMSCEIPYYNIELDE